MLIILNALKLYLNELRRRGPALRDEVSNDLAFIDLSNALDGERPEDLLADHDKDPALVHTAGIGDEREGDLEDAEGLDLELWFGGVEQAEDFFTGRGGVEHLDAHCDVVLERVAELYRIGVLLHQPVVYDEGREGDGGETHATEIIFPIPDFFRCKLDIRSLYIV